MSTYLSHAGPGKFSPSGPMLPSKAVVRALGTICRFVSFRAQSIDKTPWSSALGRASPFMLCKMLSINVLGWLYKHLIIGCFSRFFGLSGHMARTLRKDRVDDINTRASARANPGETV